MNQFFLKSISFVFYKELSSELRTRTSITAILLFIVTTITIVSLSIFKEDISSGIAAGIIWLLMFFNAMLGLTKSFVSEEERGTSLFLKLNTRPLSVYFGKLIFNILFAIQYNFLTVLLFIFFSDGLNIKSKLFFFLIIFAGSIALASVSTIISAIIAKAGNKNAIFPILSFPLVIPIILIGVKILMNCLDGILFEEIITNLIVILGYSIIIILLSVILFDYVWKD